MVFWSESLSECEVPDPVSVRQQTTKAENTPDDSNTTAEHHLPPAIQRINRAITATETSCKKLAVIDIDIFHNELDLTDIYRGCEISKQYISLIRDTEALCSGDKAKYQSSVSPFGNREVILLLTDWEN